MENHMKALALSCSLMLTVFREGKRGEGKRGQTLNLNVSEGKTKFVVASGLVG